MALQKRLLWWRIFIFCSFVLLLVACAPVEMPASLPTQAAAAQLPTATAVSVEPTTLPATLDLSALVPTVAPTAVLPTATPRPTATPGPASVKITDPAAAAVLTLDSDITVRGLVQLGAGQTVSLTLRALNGRWLTETVALAEDSFWEARLRVPPFVSGVGELTAVVVDGAAGMVASDVVPVRLALATATAERYLALFRPQGGETAVGGYNFFFDGDAQLPVGGFINVAIWGDGCQTRLASQSYPLRGSGYWQAFLVLPPDVVGEACAIAGFGTPGEETWREVQLPVTILPAADAEAKGVVIGNPPAGGVITAGQELFVYGTALNAQAALVRVSVLLENGRIISESDSSTDFWGYWEQAIFLPIDVEGPAQVTVTVGEPDEPFYSEATTTIEIVPAATAVP